MGYSKVAIKGVSWVGALRLATRFIALFRTVVLARLLTPAQFGVYGIAALVIELVEILTETGINVFLIQEKARIKNYLSTAWLVSIARGVIIFLVIVGMAPLVAAFFKNASALPLILLISLVPLIRGFINPSLVTFQKELQFGREFWFRLTVFFIDSAMAVILAILTREASSLVWGLIAGSVAEVALSFIFIKPRPQFTFDTGQLRKIINRGKWVTLAGIFDYFFRRGDDMVVGRMLNAYSLGLYQMAYRLAELPITEVAVVVSRVTFPIYTKIATDRVRLQKAFVKTMLIISLIIIPIGIILFVFPSFIIEIILGSKWREAAAVLQVLAIFGVIRAFANSFNSLFLAVKKQEYATIMMLVGLAGLGISIVPLVIKFGIVGAGISAIMGSLVALPVALYLSWKVFKNI
ncbi:lipopolysaccharide biosynthesis protein [Candidatus Microgenomates bacterium]|nr:lipopolysaccharide biosynthesis protein [Candidatus Microgenomates bacterium]